MGHEVGPYVRAMERFGSQGRMLPEQVWDAQDIPERRLWSGRGTGSATPLAWAHAEYLRLLRSRRDGQVFDRIPDVYDRYVAQQVQSNLVIWKFNHKVRAMREGQRLRVEVGAHVSFTGRATIGRRCTTTPWRRWRPTPVSTRSSSPRPRSRLAGPWRSPSTGQRPTAGRAGILWSPLPDADGGPTRSARGVPDTHQTRPNSGRGRGGCGGDSCSSAAAPRAMVRVTISAGRRVFDGLCSAQYPRNSGVYRNRRSAWCGDAEAPPLRSTAARSCSPCPRARPRSRARLREDPCGKGRR